MNLRSKRLRTVLTVAGITIGIGAIFFLISFGLGLRSIVTNQVLGNTSIRLIDVSSPSPDVVKLNDNALERLRGFGHVSGATGSYSAPGITAYSSSEIDSVVYGVDDAYLRMIDLAVTEGRLIKNSDQKTALLNTAMLETIGISDATQMIDQKVTLTLPFETGEPIVEEFTVVGVVESGSGSEIYIPNFVFATAGINDYAEIKISVDDSNSLQDVRSQIESLGYETSSPADTVDQINQIFGFFNVILLGFGSIGMIVAILGMFNTLTISLLERTKEIGLMISTGFRNKDIRMLFIIESLILSVAGAVVGMFLAWLFGLVVNSAMNSFAEQRGVNQTFDLFAEPWWLIGLLVLFMVSIGFIVVYFPARRASKVNPIDALRRE
jgi:putative ABC transport system permease protein